LIVPVYDDGILQQDLHILHNNTELRLHAKHSKLRDGPIEILAFDFTSDRPVDTITVHYGGIAKDYTIPHLQSETKVTLALSTLFKDDYALINVFYQYYWNQGVTHFYMYYNGRLSDDVLSKYNLPGVTLIEWDFPYWNRDCRFRHHAQMGQMHHALYKYGKDMNEYMILCDLDEYCHVPNSSLVDYFGRHPTVDVFGFKNCWADTHDQAIPDAMPSTFQCSNIIQPFGVRSKCAYKTKAIKTVGIHRPNDFWYVPSILHENIMFHFYRWSGKKRVEETNQLITLSHVC
jgi:hypothetical protein